MECLCNGRSGRDPYSEAVRTFCLSVQYYSPRTYAYIREKFNNTLPHAATLRSWLNNSNIDASPGIIASALEVVQNRTQKMREDGKTLICNLVFDEMSIRKHGQWCPRTRCFVGYSTFGVYASDPNDLNTDESPDDLPVANQAIVFMLSGISDCFQIPIAFYFIRSLDAEYRMILLNYIIGEISKRDITIASVTFDGYASNASMCQLLGADLKNEPNFKNPVTGAHYTIA